MNNNIPLENFIDTEKLLKIDNKDTMADAIHPNQHGYGVLAQELYMRFAFSQNLKERINLIYESNIPLNEWQKHITTENKERVAASKAAKESKTTLLQEEMSKFKIELSQKCHD